MPTGDLVLGGVIATDWQIPGKIEGLGGRHRFAISKVIGGTRYFDALGPDDDVIRWTGRFRGSNALQNAQAWDSMRAAGMQVPLYMIGIYRLVVIGDFNFMPEKPYEIPYSIKCLVVSNPLQGNLSPNAGSLDDVVGADMNSMTAIQSSSGSYLGSGPVEAAGG